MSLVVFSGLLSEEVPKTKHTHTNTNTFSTLGVEIIFEIPAQRQFPLLKEGTERALCLLIPALGHSLIAQEQGIIRTFVRVKQETTHPTGRNRKSGSRCRMNGHRHPDQFGPITPGASGLGCDGIWALRKVSWNSK